MKRAEHILQSKKDIKLSDSLNVTFELSKSIDELEIKNDDFSYLQMIPVRIVASNESFFKKCFSSILDYNSKYVSNVKTLLKRNGTKIDLEDVLHIVKSKYSIGELISYSLSYSSIDSILKSFQEITGISFYSEFKNTVDYLTGLESDGNLHNNERAFDLSRILKNLEGIYEQRHVICHDFLSSSHKIQLEPDKLKDWIMDTVVMQESINFLCSMHIYNDIPTEPRERVAYYNALIDKKISELNNEYKSMESSFQSKEQFERFEIFKQRFLEHLETDSSDLGYWFSDDGPFEELVLDTKVKLLETRINFIKTDRKNSS